MHKQWLNLNGHLSSGKQRTTWNWKSMWKQLKTAKLCTIRIIIYCKNYTCNLGKKKFFPVEMSNGGNYALKRHFQCK